MNVPNSTYKASALQDEYGPSRGYCAFLKTSINGHVSLIDEAAVARRYRLASISRFPWTNGQSASRYT